MLIRCLTLVFTVFAGFALAIPANASVIARVDLSEQEMQVVVDGEIVHRWDVSTGRSGYDTPTGVWRPVRMHTMWRSRTYNNAPMPHAVFFYGGYAVHATNAVGRLGSRASHGCIRLSPDNARAFYELVRKFGPHHTRIQIRD